MRTYKPFYQHIGSPPVGLCYTNNLNGANTPARIIKDMQNIRSLDSYLAVIEKYLLADDRVAFVKALPPGSPDASLFELLACNDQTKFNELCQRLGVGQAQELWTLRTIFLLQSDASEADKVKAIELLKDQLHLNFEYQRPTAFSAAQMASSSSKGIDTLTEADYSLQAYMKERSNPTSDACRQLTESGLMELTSEEIGRLNLASLQTYLTNVNLASLGQSVFPLLKSYVSQQKKHNANFTLNLNAFKRLTHSQLEALPRHLEEVLLDRAYFASLFKKGWKRELDEISELPNIETPIDLLVKKRDLISKIRKWLEGFKSGLMASFMDQLVIESLQLDVLIGTPDIPLFEEFLRRPKEYTSAFCNDHRVRIQNRSNYNYDNFWHSVHGLEVGRSFNQTKLIESYLKLVFADAPDIKRAELFYAYFEKSYVNGIYYRVLLAQGKVLPDLQNLLPKNQIDQLTARKELTILDTNKKRFDVKEDVVIKLRVKNIKIITAEVYQLSTEKHYLSTESDIDDTVSLDFIQPLKQVSKEVEAGTPFKESTVDFSLVGVIQNKPSVYIVNFRGEGVSSRAVIRRGSIVAFSKQTLTGVEIRFYQEDSTPIKQLDVWCNNRLLHVKDKHIIPYGRAAQGVRLVAVKDGFAEAVNIHVPAESYRLNVSYIHHEENFLIGTKAKVVLQARLFNRDSLVTIKALKESRITVAIQNHKGIDSTFEVSPIEWDHKNEYVLEIPVQTYLRVIAITVTAKVDMYEGEPVTVTSNQAIMFRNAENDPSFVELFLAKDGEDYKLQLLGKNGEPKPAINLTVEVFSQLYNGSINKPLTTNEKGEVNLGKLVGVTQLTARTTPTPDIQPVASTWPLGKVSNQIQYPASLCLQSGQSFSLPLWKGFDLGRHVQFYRNGDDNEVISNEKAVLTVTNGRLTGKLTQPGNYVLQFLPLGSSLSITVVQAVEWEADGQLYNQQSRQVITVPSNSQQLIGLNDPKIEKIEGGYAVEMQLNLPGDIPLESVRAHVISSAFVYGVDQTADVRKTLPSLQPIHYQKFTSKKCSYLSNKQLSDEQCYILNRQNQAKFVGNNLEKPRLLIKRIETKETGFDQEQLKEAGEYARKDECERQKRACNDRAAGGMSRSSMTRNASGTGQFSTKNNFLRYPSSVDANLHGKTLVFKVPAHHQSFKVLLTSQTMAIEREYGLPQTQLPLKDLRHQGLDDGDKSKEQGITMSRQIYKLQKGESLRVKRTSMWSAVSSTNVAAYSAIKNAKVWEWVMDWPTYTPEKKQQVYNDNCCHELNVYLRYKDSEFFEGVVKPFIANKLEKGIVDYCLLEHPKAKDYVSPAALTNLNAFEKCLLVDYLVASKEIDAAKSIAASLQLKEKGNIVSGEQYQRLFDTIVTSKMLQQKRAERFSPAGGFGASSARYTDTRTSACMDFAGPPPPPMAGCPPPMPMMSMMKKCMAMPMSRMTAVNLMDDAFEENAEQYLAERKAYKPAFKPVEKTKEYIETTYFGMTNPKNSSTHVAEGKFWVDLAAYLLSDRKVEFLSENFLYLNNRQQFALAISFLPSVFAARYQLESTDESIVIRAQSTFFAFVKEVVPVEFSKKYGVLVSQRYFDPSDPYSTDEDGTQLEKNVTELIKDKVYACQTVVVNTSVAQLDLQILQDIPQGSLPMLSYEYTKITSDVIGAYAIKAYEARFYFPSAGTYRGYPSNTSKNSKIIAKADQPDALVVKDFPTATKLQSFTDILRSGTEKDIVRFLRQKNIFDSKVFDVSQILWMLKDRNNYREVLDIFRSRSYFNKQVWSFGVLHSDLPTATEYLNSDRANLLDVQLFEYFPLSSNRAHKFMKESKSTILNKEFKKTYQTFLLTVFFNLTVRDTEKNRLALAYYLTLQDRVQDADKVFRSIQKVRSDVMQNDRPGFPSLQYDYMACFLDLYTGFPNFVIARELSAKHKDHSVLAWKKLFSAVHQLLTSHDTQAYTEEPTKQHDIRITNRGDHLVVSLPEKSQVELNFHAINLELLFSQSPFLEVKTFSTVKPFKTIVVKSEKGGDEKVDRPVEHADMFVHPVDLASQQQAQVLDSFLWNNPNVKAKVLEDQGLAYVYLEGKAKPGAYCKVYAKDANGTRFFKDGYTDIQGKFKYITSDIDGIESFAILFLTELGGIVKYGRKPNMIGTV